MRTHIDGGVVLNNPSTVALAAALKKWPKSQIRLLSMGTGIPVVKGDDSSVVKTINSMINFVAEVNSSHVTTKAMVDALGPDRCRYYRVNHLLEERLHPLDKPENMRDLMLAGKDWFSHELKKIGTSQEENLHKFFFCNK
jgi:hypothetical protein